jgi:hypothetical protein
MGSSKVAQFEAALLTVPMDMIALFVRYGAENAFMWTGVAPSDVNTFYMELGRQLQRFKQKAAEKELPYGIGGKE